MPTPRPGLARLLLSLGAVAASASLLTAAAVTDSADLAVVLDGDRNRFDLRVAGSSDEAWLPTPDDWAQGEPHAVEVPVGTDALVPGGSVRYRVAVQNASPRIAGAVSLEIVDPVDRTGEIDESTGRFVELFDQLHIVVRDPDGTVIDRAPGAAPMLVTWAQPLAAGAEILLDVEVAMPAEIDDRWQGASTDLRFEFAGASA